MKSPISTILLFVFITGFVLLVPTTAMADNGEKAAFSNKAIDLYSHLFNPLPADPRAKKQKFKLRLHGYMQIRFTAIEGDHHSNHNDNDYWNVYRMRLHALMHADPNLQTFFQLEFRQEIALLDAYAQWRLNDQLVVQAGQFIPKFGWQHHMNPRDLAIINYAMVVNALAPTSTLRDQGIMISGSIKNVLQKKRGKKKPLTLDTFFWHVGVFNGAGLNVPGDDGHGAYLVRVGTEIPLKKVRKQLGDGSTKTDIEGTLKLGISYWSQRKLGAWGHINIARFGFDWQLKMSDFIFKGEYIANGGSTHLDDDIAGEPGLSGFFFQFGYEMKVNKTIEKIVPMVRYDFYHDESAEDGEGDLTSIAIGANLHFSKSAWLQVFYEMRLEEYKFEYFSPVDDSLVASPKHNDQFIVQINVRW